MITFLNVLLNFLLSARGDEPKGLEDPNRRAHRPVEELAGRAKKYRQEQERGDGGAQRWIVHVS